MPKVLKWATEEVDNPDLRDRGLIYWRMLSTDPAAAGNVVLADKPPISTESEVLDRGLLDRLLLHTGSLASIYQKEAHTFVRGALPKYLHDSSALSQEAKDSYLEAMRLPALRAPAAPAASDPPAVPARPAVGREESGEVMGAREYSSATLGAPRAAATAGLLDDVDEDDDEEEGTALNPNVGGAGRRGDDDDDEDDDEEDDELRNRGGGAGGDDGRDEPLDPYASLARMSMDDGWTGLGARGNETGYGYDGPQPVQGNNDLLL